MTNIQYENVYSTTATGGCSEVWLPLAPLMMWMLSPALILVCVSDELVEPGITMSKDNLIKWYFVFSNLGYDFGH